MDSASFMFYFTTRLSRTMNMEFDVSHRSVDVFYHGLQYCPLYFIGCIDINRNRKNGVACFHNTKNDKKIEGSSDWLIFSSVWCRTMRIFTHHSYVWTDRALRHESHLAMRGPALGWLGLLPSQIFCSMIYVKSSVLI